MYFAFCVIISPWKRAGPFIWQTWIPSPKDALCQVWLKWNGSWEDFLNFVNVFLLLRNYHPLEKGRALHLSKLDSPKWILRRSFLNFVNVILLFCNYLPWKRAGPFIWTPFTQGCCVPSLAEIDAVVLEKKMKMWKVYDNNDDGQQTNFDQKN